MHCLQVRLLVHLITACIAPPVLRGAVRAASGPNMTSVIPPFESCKRQSSSFLRTSSDEARAYPKGGCGCRAVSAASEAGPTSPDLRVGEVSQSLRLEELARYLLDVPMLAVHRVVH